MANQHHLGDLQVTAGVEVRYAAPAALVQFSKSHDQNPFSQPRMRALTTLIKRLSKDDTVACIVLSGGEGRSFSVGGDFHETASFKGGDEVDKWIDDFTSLYTTIAGIPKPVVAAIEGYAIGIGLQIALCCDYRIGSESCHLVMPELGMGIACNFGGYMLETLVGRSVMQKMLFTSDKWTAADALRDGLLHEVVSAGELLSHGLQRAETIGSWSPSAVQGTRPHINATLVAGLITLGDQAKRSHRAAFATGHAQTKMESIISKKTPAVVPPWILFANVPVPSLAKTLQRAGSHGVYVYGQGTALSSPAYVWLEKDADSNMLPDWEGQVVLDGEKVCMRTGAMNETPLYMVRNTLLRAWAIGTDSFMLNVVRSQWDMTTGFANPTGINSDETTSFLGVTRLPAHSHAQWQKEEKDWKFTLQQLQDPLLEVFSPKTDDYDQAGKAFIASLQRAISKITQGEQAIATLLSGGIDSGAVTTFAVMSGLKVTAYSAGTPWGNEHDEAEELANYLEIPHVRIDFSTDELLAAIPETIRSLGTAERDRVDIALTVTALLRSNIIKEQHILTGYGSDLLNLGLPPKSKATRDLQQDIYDGMNATRHTGEFTDWVACARGKKLSNPYWHEDVIRTALQIHPGCKIRDGREKAFFRQAMEPYVPMSTAWRKKIGIHLGGGLQGGLDATFGGIDCKVRAYDKAFREISKCLLTDPFAEVDHIELERQQVNGVHSEIKTPPTRGLTPSGAGRELEGHSGGLVELAKTIQTATLEAGFVVVRGVTLDEERFKELANAIGEPITHKYQKGGSDLLKLEATREKGNVVLGRGPLPLHSDGVIVGNAPDIILLYASEISEQEGSGETFIVDEQSALEDMPKSLRQVLAEGTFEYQVQETGHFPGDGEKWTPVRPLQKTNGREQLHLALQSPPAADRSWVVRVAGATIQQSDTILRKLNQFFCQPRYKYQHRWNVGDLLVVDNCRTLHGRTSISDKGTRVLFRGQVNRRDSSTTGS